MTSRERIKAILAGQPVDRCGLWLGNPHEKTLEIYCDYFGVDSEEALRVALGDDIRWIRPDRIGNYYHDPSGKTHFDRGFTEHTFGRPGPLADCEEVSQVDDFPWPDPQYLRFDDCMEVLDQTGEYYRMGGFWTDFFHQVSDLFGMENYLMKMFTDPEEVQADPSQWRQIGAEVSEQLDYEPGRFIRRRTVRRTWAGEQRQSMKLAS